jgi:hypothetical protein
MSKSFQIPVFLILVIASFAVSCKKPGPDPPLAITMPATDVSAVSASLNGTVNTRGLPAIVSFDYGTTDTYGKIIVANAEEIRVDHDTNIVTTLSGLAPNTTYHYRIKVVSESGSGVGKDFTFGTPPEPSIQSLSASNVKYGQTLTVTGNNFSQVSQVFLGSSSQYIIATPKSSSETAIGIEVYNHQDPTRLLEFSVFRVGLVYNGGITWSEPVNIAGSWARMADLPAPARYKAGYFSVGGKFYTGCGASEGITLRDFWRYDPPSNNWTQMADFPGVSRVYAMGTADNNYGYMGTGHTADNSSRIQLYDFYKYNPGTNVWSTIPDYPDLINNFFLNYSISVNGHPYVSLSNVVQNTREIVNDSWVSHPNVSDLMDSGGNPVFVFGNSYYVICGYRFGTMIINNAVWEYNTLTSTWIRKANFPGPARNLAIFFTIGNYGYMGCGTTPANQQFTDMWRYNPSNDSWIRIEDFPGGKRSHAVSASIGDYGFAGFGSKARLHNIL